MSDAPPDIDARVWPADSVERWPLDKLIPYARNARTHGDAQIEQLAASIREWGWTMPVLCDEAGGIIAGHGRVLAARRVGIESVPVMVARGWSEAQIRAYVIADNKLAENATWDFDLMRGELAELRGAFDLSLTGVAPSLLESLFSLDTLPERALRERAEREKPPPVAFRSFIVHFRDADAVARFAALLGQDIGGGTRALFFPPPETQNGNAT